MKNLIDLIRYGTWKARLLVGLVFVLCVGGIALLGIGFSSFSMLFLGIGMGSLVIGIVLAGMVRISDEDAGEGRREATPKSARGAEREDSAKSSGRKGSEDYAADDGDFKNRSEMTGSRGEAKKAKAAEETGGAGEAAGKKVTEQIGESGEPTVITEVQITQVQGKSVRYGEERVAPASYIKTKDNPLPLGGGGIFDEVRGSSPVPRKARSTGFYNEQQAVAVASLTVSPEDKPGGRYKNAASEADTGNQPAEENADAQSGGLGVVTSLKKAPDGTVQKPAEGSEASQKPQGSVYAQKPSEGGEASQKPQGSVNAQKPSESGEASQKPQGSVSTQKPAEGGEASQKPQGSVSTQKPAEGGEASQKPQGSVSTQKPAEGSEASQKPQGSVSTQKPAQGGEASQKPVHGSVQVEGEDGKSSQSSEQVAVEDKKPLPGSEQNRETESMTSQNSAQDGTQDSEAGQKNGPGMEAQPKNASDTDMAGKPPKGLFARLMDKIKGIDEEEPSDLRDKREAIEEEKGGIREPEEPVEVSVKKYTPTVLKKIIKQKKVSRDYAAIVIDSCPTFRISRTPALCWEKKGRVWFLLLEGEERTVSIPKEAFTKVGYKRKVPETNIDKYNSIRTDMGAYGSFEDVMPTFTVETDSRGNKSYSKNLYIVGENFAVTPRSMRQLKSRFKFTFDLFDELGVSGEHSSYFKKAYEARVMWTDGVLTQLDYQNRISRILQTMVDDRRISRYDFGDDLDKMIQYRLITEEFADFYHNLRMKSER